MNNNTEIWQTKLILLNFHFAIKVLKRVLPKMKSDNEFIKKPESLTVDFPFSFTMLTSFVNGGYLESWSECTFMTGTAAWLKWPLSVIAAFMSQCFLVSASSSCSSKLHFLLMNDMVTTPWSKNENNVRFFNWWKSINFFSLQIKISHLDQTEELTDLKANWHLVHSFLWVSPWWLFQDQKMQTLF